MISTSTTQIIQFVLMGLLGGVAYALINAEGWDDLKTFKTFRHILISLIVGGLYYVLYSEWNYPNMVMSFISGYMGPSFIAGITKKLSKEIKR